MLLPLAAKAGLGSGPAVLLIGEAMRERAAPEQAGIKLAEMATR